LEYQKGIIYFLKILERKIVMGICVGEEIQRLVELIKWKRLPTSAFIAVPKMSIPDVL
jgi:hypothetical protein